MNSKQAIKWAISTLNANNITHDDSIKIVVSTPWSTVTRINTTTGHIYLKQSSQHLCFEPKVIALLSHYTSYLPSVIAGNQSLNCLLMTDSGISLREYINSNHQLEPLMAAIAQYARIQKLASGHIESLFAIDIPDWRLSELPKHFESLTNNQELMKSEGITEHEHELIKQFIPTIQDLCSTLAGYNITETLDHSDFHSNNILIDQKQRLTIIDWSEVTITHPYFSLVTFLNQAERHHNIKTNSPVYQSILNHYLSNTGTDIKISDDALALARKLWPVYSALAFYRLMQSCPADQFKLYYAARPNRIAEYIRLFIKQDITIRR